MLSEENNAATPQQGPINTDQKGRTTVVEEVTQTRQDHTDKDSQDHAIPSQQSLVQPNIEANIMLWRDSLVAPLVQELKELRLENVTLNRENVTLARDKEDLASRVKELEDTLAAQEVRRALEVEFPIQVVSESPALPQTPKERSWLYRWFSRKL